MSKYTDTPAIIQVIGNIYNNPNILDNEKYKFYEEDFPNEFHKIIFGTIFNLHALGAKEININAIEDYLYNRPTSYGLYQTNKGREYLEKVSSEVSLSTFEYYYYRMKKMTLLRMYDKAGMDLKWLYDPDNILDSKKKQAQEDWLDNTSLEDIAETIDRKINEIKLKYVDGTDDLYVQAGDRIDELIESLQKNPEVGYPLYGPLVNTVTRGARLKKLYLRSAATGVGKAIPNYTLIPTINGFKQVGEIQIGDYLIGQDGIPTQVLATYPQSEEKEIWKVTFADGRVAECCKDHLWEYRYETHRGKNYRVESLEELYNRTLKLKNGLKDSSNKGYRFHIRLNKEVQYPTKQYSVHPYVMGALLGDGSFRYNNINKALTFSSETNEIPMLIAQLTQTVARKSSEFNYDWTFHINEHHNLWVEELLSQYPELWNIKSEDKFIPSDYLLGDIAQRYALLQGLMDTDGSIDEKGRTCFTTTSIQLRDDIIELVRSLGMIATYTIDNREDKYTTGACYKINIQCEKGKKHQLFKLQRKINIAYQYEQSTKRCEYKDHLAIVNIEKTNKKTAMTCFTVDNNNHLFLMNDYIVTHNTRAMIADACNIACDEIYNLMTRSWEVNGTKEPTLFITTEQEVDEIQTMMLAFLSGVNEGHIIYNHYEDGELDRVKYAAKLIKSSPLHIKRLPDFSLQDIENAIKFGIHEWGVRYVFFDYLHTSLKILSEVSSKAGIKGLREDNVLFMIAIRLKDLCNEYGVFIMTSTQLNADYVTAQQYDQNLLRGAKAIADKIDFGAIMLQTSQEDKDALKPILVKQNLPEPVIKISVYKNRRGQYKDILLWCKADRGICRIEPMFATTYQYELVDLPDLKIKVNPAISASAF